MKGYVTEDDMIHRLQIIRDLVRYDRKFDADVNLDSLQRILAEEKLTTDNIDYAKCPCCDEPWNIREHDSCSCGAFIAKRS